MGVHHLKHFHSLKYAESQSPAKVGPFPGTSREILRKTHQQQTFTCKAMQYIPVLKTYSKAIGTLFSNLVNIFMHLMSLKHRKKRTVQLSDKIQSILNLELINSPLYSSITKLIRLLPGTSPLLTSMRHPLVEATAGRDFPLPFRE